MHPEGGDRKPGLQTEHVASTLEPVSIADSALWIRELLMQGFTQTGTARDHA
jgi:hypothetical protein